MGPTARQGVVGRIYLAFLGLALLLLVTWHFAIQAAAHDAVVQQVRAWMQQQGASVGSVQYRLLRGALSMDMVKGHFKGRPIVIEHIFIKGNPASLPSEQPKLHLVRIENITLDMQQLNLHRDTIEVPVDLSTIFRHAHTLTLRNIHLKNIEHMPDVWLNDLQVLGEPALRLINANGYFNTPENPWSLQASLPSDISQQSGEILFNYDATQGVGRWSGAWKTENLSLAFERQASPNMQLQASFQQQDVAWQGNVSLLNWPLQWDNATTNISGSAAIAGTIADWHLQSERLQLSETTLPDYHTLIAFMDCKNIQLHAAAKTLAIESISMRDAKLTLDTMAKPPAWGEWNTNIGHIAIASLGTNITLPSSTVQLPSLNGTGNVSGHQLSFDLTGHDLGENFWRIQSTTDEKIHIIASDVPLLKLRNFLPSPWREQTERMEGKATLLLNVQPAQQWQLDGAIQASNVYFATKEQAVSTDALQLTILQANAAGVQDATIDASQWLLQLPLNLSQAWSQRSQFEDWARVPWSLSNITLQHGRVAFGLEENVWLSDVQVTIGQWQTQTPASLNLEATFGMEKLTLAMQMQPDDAQVMQWRQLDLNIEDANLSPITDWLELSGYPTVEQGHISAHIQASKKEHDIEGHANISLNQLILTHNTASKASNISSPFTPDISNTVDLDFPFAGQGDWSLLATQAMLAQLQSQPERTQTTVLSHQISTRLGSLRLHHDTGLSLNERTRLRKMLRPLKAKDSWVLTLEPDFGTAIIDDTLLTQMQSTQQLIKSFLNRQGIPSSRIFPILAQAKHHSPNATGAVHINILR